MTKLELLAASALALVVPDPLAAQKAQTAVSDGATTSDPQDIVVTAQRQSQRLQDVPIAVSAFTAQAIEKQQIVNPSTLQQTLPNITYTKTNFTSSSFTIRGIGDLCVGTTCDSATAIHVNDMPLLSTRLFESEFFDLERIEVLRGPQGTLFGRNATSGVINFISAKPDLSAVHAAGEVEYGNYESKRARAMLNLPITDTIGVRIAGTYLDRGGYTLNTYDGSRIDGRDLHAVRGTLSWSPGSDTRIDLIGYYFHEKDDRSRIQKQRCHRDATGVLGCLPDTLRNETTNGLSTLAAVLTSTEFFRINNAALAPFALQSVYGVDPYAGVVNPADVRTVRVDFNPRYFADEEQYTAKVFHDFGPVSVNFTGGYMRNSVDSQTDFNLAVEAPLATNPGLLALNAAGRPGGPAAFLNGVRTILIPNGPAGGVCQSASDPRDLGVYGGNAQGCFAQSLDFDRSRISTRQYSAEAHVDSSFDGAFNVLLGGLYFDSRSRNNDYFVNAFGLDYASGILGAASSAAIPGVAGNAYLATPFYRNDTQEFRLKSYGVFGEAYLAVSDRLKLTAGLRYNHDQKYVRARNLTINVLTPYSATSITQGLNYAATDFDPATDGVQEFATRDVSFSRVTGRAVIDYRISADNLLYASYSRGYKSGGLNPPIPAAFSVPSTFSPEKVDAYEIGSKNTFDGGRLRLNLTGFYYKYKGLQLSRIVARTAVNDNVDADIYGVEAEAVLIPTPRFVVNMNASYLHSAIASDTSLINPRLPSAGRSDTVLIKDLAGASNCVVVPGVAGDAAGANAFVGAVNGALGLRPPTPVEATNTTGAFSVCQTLAQIAAGSVPTASPLYALQQGLRAAFGVPTGAFPFTVADGVGVDIRGNRLPQAPTYKFAVGAQYTIDFAGGWTLVPRVDLNYTGNLAASVFNLNIDRVQGYEVVNAQVQLSAPDDRFYVRAFVQNLTDNDAVTGQAAADQSSGLFTNIFTIEPRRYGIAAGFKF